MWQTLSYFVIYIAEALIAWQYFSTVFLSDYKKRDFGMKFGTYIKELGLLTRAVFVVDEADTVTYVEYCEEITSEPNYANVLQALKR